MAIQLGDEAPNFTADTTEGSLDFHQYLGEGWGVLFSHPADFTPVCTTELGAVAKLKDEFEQRDTKVVGLSVDPLDSHERWASGEAVEHPDTKNSLEQVPTESHPTNRSEQLGQCFPAYCEISECQPSRVGKRKAELTTLDDKPSNEGYQRGVRITCEELTGEDSAPDQPS